MQKVLLIKNHTQQDLSNNFQVNTKCQRVTYNYSYFLLFKWLEEGEVTEVDLYEPYYNKEQFLEVFRELDDIDEGVLLVDIFEQKEKELNLQLIGNKEDDKQDNNIIARNTLKLVQELNQEVQVILAKDATRILKRINEYTDEIKQLADFFKQR